MYVWEALACFVSGKAFAAEEPDGVNMGCLMKNKRLVPSYWPVFFFYIKHYLNKLCHQLFDGDTISNFNSTIQDFSFGNYPFK
ncbi:hypothetical protein AHAS_Ahas03G0072900 [Arachis hypogaea]